MGCSNDQDCVHDTPNQIRAPKSPALLSKSRGDASLLAPAAGCGIAFEGVFPLFAFTPVIFRFNSSTTALLLKSDPLHGCYDSYYYNRNPVNDLLAQQDNQSFLTASTPTNFASRSHTSPWYIQQALIFLAAAPCSPEDDPRVVAVGSLQTHHVSTEEFAVEDLSPTASYPKHQFFFIFSII